MVVAVVATATAAVVVDDDDVFQRHFLTDDDAVDCFLVLASLFSRDYHHTSYRKRISRKKLSNRSFTFPLW